MTGVVDPVARWIAGIAVVISIIEAVILYLNFRRSGGRLRVQARVIKHHYDPLQHRIRIQVTNVGQLPITVRAMGLEWKAESQTQAQQARLSLDTAPTKGTLPVELKHGDVVTGEVTFAEIGDKWAWNGSYQLLAWAEAKSGQKTSQWWSISVRTPPAPR